MSKLDRIMALISSGKVDDACAKLNKMVRANPRDAKAWFLLGAAHGSRKRLDEAIASSKRAVELNPDYTDAHYNLGQAYLFKKEYSLAIQHYREVVRLNPDHYDAHNNMSAALNQMGEREKAIHHLREAVRVRPDSQEARFLLAGLTGEAHPAPPAKYVRGLFDGYADFFERHLVIGLKYQVPQIFQRVIGKLIGEDAQGLVVADLGCGTGLMGPVLRGWARRLDGVDLSPKMIERAQVRGFYDHLEVGELVAYLESRPREYDLITAADVLIYIGDPSPCFVASHAALQPGGILAFSVEASDDDSKSFELCATYRYKHGKDALVTLARETGFVVEHMEEIVIRMEVDRPVRGYVTVLRAESRAD